LGNIDNRLFHLGKFFVMKWIFIIVIAIAAISLNGCAKDATAEDSPTTTPIETQDEVRTNATSGEVIWISIVLTWRPVIYTIDKEFTSEVNCWNYYESGVGESKFGTQHLDHQGNKPDKEYMKKNRPPHREYPTRMYYGTGETGQTWLTCDIKGR
jgi:hypothetical protein